MKKEKYESDREGNNKWYSERWTLWRFELFYRCEWEKDVILTKSIRLTTDLFRGRRIIITVQSIKFLGL